MTILQAAFLGLVQGIAEFLPISSSGHLNLMQALFHMEIEQPLLFNILLHAGTLFAVAVVYWKDWMEMLLHPIRNKKLMLLCVASLPALATKILLDEPLAWTDTHNTLLGWCFLATGLMLLLTQRLSIRRNEVNRKDCVGIREALGMGCLQAVGMLPGISRSGSTIFGGVCAGLKRETAAKFSFMMSAPAIMGGLLSEGMEVINQDATIGGELPTILAGMLVAGISGYLAIRFFLKLISKASLNGFAVYMIILGIVVIALQLTGIMTDASQQMGQMAAMR